MPTPRSLTTAPHADFELEVVAGSVARRHQRRDGVLQPAALHRHGLRASSTGARSAVSHCEPGTRGALAGSLRLAGPVHPVTRASGCGTALPAQFTTSGTGYQSVFGAANASNTAPLPWGGRLFTTWDAGRPVELHPGTLEFVAEVGHRDSWGGSSLDMPGVLPFLLSSAHPVADPDRDCLWTREARLRDGAELRDATGGGALRPGRRHPGAALAARRGRVRRIDPHRQPDPRLDHPRRLRQLQARPGRDVRRRTASSPSTTRSRSG